MKQTMGRVFSQASNVWANPIDGYIVDLVFDPVTHILKEVVFSRSLEEGSIRFRPREKALWASV